MQSHSCKKIVVVLFYPYLGGISGFMPFPRVLVWKWTKYFLRSLFIYFFLLVFCIRSYRIRVISQIYLTLRWDPNKCYHSVDLRVMAVKGLHSSDLENRSFCLVSYIGNFFGGRLTSLQGVHLACCKVDRQSSLF